MDEDEDDDGLITCERCDSRYHKYLIHTIADEDVCEHCLDLDDYTEEAFGYYDE